MKNYIKILTAFALLFISEANAQIGIGTTNVNQSAMLHIVAAPPAVGLLVPRLTTAQRDSNIKSPLAGLVIYNSTTNDLEVAINGSLWIDVVKGTTSPVASGVTTSTGKVGVGTEDPNANAVLDVLSTTKGVLLPQAATDPTGVAGMLYYNTTTDVVKLYNGASWVALIN
jgi:hypothetical protein